MLAFLFTAIYAHSWLECTDYRGSLETYEKDKCLGLPRPLGGNRNVGNVFGQDIGMDFRPNGNRCQGDAKLGINANFAQGIRKYEVGKKYTLAWPPKNHAAASCTNAFIPDTSLKLFMTKYDQARGDPDQATFKQNQVKASFSDDPHVKGALDFKGFQNCPKFCDNTDKSLCTGTFEVAPGTAPGIYTFQWYWAFNSEADLYSTCWEAEVVASTGTGTGGNTGTGTGGNTGTGTGGNTGTKLPETTTTSTTLPPNCIGCCQGGKFEAPGTWELVSHNYLKNSESLSLKCPEKFTGQFKILCLNGETRHVEGFCEAGGSDVSGNTGGSENLAQEVVTRTDDSAVVGLSLTLTFVTLAFIAYVAVTRGWVAECMENNKTIKHNQMPERYEAKPQIVQKRRAESVFTESKTELPIVPPTKSVEWHYVFNNETVGPISRDQLIECCKSMTSKAQALETLVWNGEDVDDWTPLEKVPALRLLL